MTFIAFVQTIDGRQIESAIATVFRFGANCYGRKSNFTHGLQFAVNRNDDGIGARFLVHFMNGPATHRNGQRKCQDPPGSVART